MEQNFSFSEFLSESSECEYILVFVWKLKETRSPGKPRFVHNMLVILTEYNATLNTKSGRDQVAEVVEKAMQYVFLKMRSSLSVA
jgi:hypothetical protein